MEASKDVCSKYDYYVVLDYEACWAATGPRTPEIIEFPRYVRLFFPQLRSHVQRQRVVERRRDDTGSRVSVLS